MASDWKPALNPEAISINSEALQLWRERGFSVEDCLAACRDIDSEAMAALVTFSGEAAVEVRVTSRTWERQEGHYPAVAELFKELVRHPNLRGMRGSFIVWLEDGMWERHAHISQRAPVFAFCRDRRDSATLLMPDPAYIASGGYVDDLARSRALCKAHPWSSRKPTVFWRGAATGLGIEGPDWRVTPRGRLCLLARELRDSSKLDAKLTRLKHLPLERVREMDDSGIVADEVPFDEFFQYRYLVDADGYACAWKSLFLKLASGATVLKIDSPFEQWYHRRLQPGRHLICLSSGLANFEDAFEWLKSHDDEAQRMAQMGDRFVRGLELGDVINELAFYCAEILAAQRS